MSEDQDRARRPLTSEQLRRAIDSGETGDKVAAADPAAAPLGTDEEAGGAHFVAPLEAPSPARPAPAHARGNRSGIWIGLAALVLAIILLAFLF